MEYLVVSYSCVMEEFSHSIFGNKTEMRRDYTQIHSDMI